MNAVHRSKPDLRAWLGPAVIALLGSLALADLPRELRWVPPWTALVLSIALIAAVAISQQRGSRHLVGQLWYALTGLMTLVQVGNILLLLRYLPSKQAVGRGLFQDAAILLSLNVALFALWYWRLDTGARDESTINRDFSFSLEDSQTGGRETARWQPGFLDYFYLAFITSFSFATADAVASSTRAKLLVMLQVGSSFLIIGVIAARAIGIF